MSRMKLNPIRKQLIQRQRSLELSRYAVAKADPENGGRIKKFLHPKKYPVADLQTKTLSKVLDRLGLQITEIAENPVNNRVS